MSGFWDATAELATIRDFAYARLSSPWATLGCALARIIASADHELVLPPLVGGAASLNLGVAIVGSSGQGKGTAEKTAAEAVTFADGERFTTQPFGSGEGISKSFVRMGEDGPEMHTRKVLFSASEVSAVDAIANRQGSTLLAQVCAMLVGERLGFKNADDSRSNIVQPMSYRAAAIIGVQPARSGGLVESADMGIPQRFVWFPATDPDISLGHDLPDMPIFIGDSSLMANSNEYQHIDLPECAVKLVRENRVRQARGETAPLDGHSLLTRLKVATALAFLHGRKNVTVNDWSLSEQVMQKSDETRAYCIAELEKGRDADAIKRGVRQGKSNAARNAAQDDADIRGAAERLYTYLVSQNPRPVAAGDLRRRLRAALRERFPDVMCLLLDEKRVVELPAPKDGIHYLPHF